jgi:ribosomal protein L37E
VLGDFVCSRCGKIEWHEISPKQTVCNACCLKEVREVQTEKREKKKEKKVTIEWQVGNYYRTALGAKVYLCGKRADGRLLFEFENYVIVSHSQEELAQGDLTIIGEWREPHVHECEIYASLLKNKSFAHDMFDFVFGTYVKGLSRKSKEGYRKFKVRVEEVIE